MMKKLVKVIFLGMIIAAPVVYAGAKHTKCTKKPVMKDQMMASKMGNKQCRLCSGRWYVAANLGVSHLYDNAAAGTANSVDENGPGWDATFGYQANRIWGGEVGYTQYYNSRETSGSTVVAKTTHFAVHANATARYPLVRRLSAVGKLGLAYSYAQKIFEATGAAGSSGSVSPYLGLGLDYRLTKRADLLAQWSFVRGNNYTGSATLYSLGVQYAL